MPSYNYKCQQCELKMTVIRGIKEAERTPICVNCVKDLVRVFDSVPSVAFKGTGWASKENNEQ